MRILTFNHHESYIALLAETGHSFTVVTKKGNLDLRWGSDRIPAPTNVSFVEWDETLITEIKKGTFDVIVAHTIKNLFWFFPFFNANFIFIAHIPLFNNSFAARLKSWCKKAFYKIFAATHHCRFVCITPWKMTTWKLRGTVIEPTVNPFPPINHQKCNNRIALVCNHIKQRQEELGWSNVEKILAEFPLTIIGENPGVPQAVKMRNFSEFKEYLQNFGIYFYPIQLPYGDGYNLGLLEAMSMGMAPVTLYNPSSPISNGVNGLVAHNLDELRAAFCRLLADEDETRRLGLAAMATVKVRFNKETFVTKWQKVFAASSAREK